jgi:nitrogen regulatory protein PII
MKAVLIVHNSAIDDDINDALASIGIEQYTKFTGVLGKGRFSEPHLNNEVWPETNYATLVVTDPALAQRLTDKIRDMRKTLVSEGIKAFCWQIDEVT